MFVVLAIAFGLGAIAGLWSATAPIVVSWAAHLRWIDKLPDLVIAQIEDATAGGRGFSPV
jgi:hypothetical protein